MRTRGDQDFVTSCGFGVHSRAKKMQLSLCLLSCQSHAARPCLMRSPALLALLHGGSSRRRSSSTGSSTLSHYACRAATATGVSAPRFPATWEAGRNEPLLGREGPFCPSPLARMSSRLGPALQSCCGQQTARQLPQVCECCTH